MIISPVSIPPSIRANPVINYSIEPLRRNDLINSINKLISERKHSGQRRGHKSALEKDTLSRIDTWMSTHRMRGRLIE